MANEEHVAILKQGVEAWNRWRTEHPDITPDLRQAATFRTDDLADPELANANLSNADLTGADLEDAVLNGANLSRATIDKALLKRADLIFTTLRYASLQEADFTFAHLLGANFVGANLKQTNFSNSRFLNTKFSSRSAINELKNPLTPEPLAGAIFEDEESFRRQQKEQQEAQTGATHTVTDIPALRVHFSTNIWTPLDLSFALAGIQLSCNRLQYLMTTDSEDLDDLQAKLNTECALPYPETIRLLSIQNGSMEFWLGHFKEYLSPRNFKVLVVVCTLMGSLNQGITTYKSIADIHLAQANADKANAEAELARVSAAKVKAEQHKIELEIQEKERARSTPCPPPMALAPANNHVPLETVKDNISIPEEFTSPSRTVMKHKEDLVPRAVQPLYSVVESHRRRGDAVIIELVNKEQGEAILRDKAKGR